MTPVKLAETILERMTTGDCQMIVYKQSGQIKWTRTVTAIAEGIYANPTAEVIGLYNKHVKLTWLLGDIKDAI